MSDSVNQWSVNTARLFTYLHPSFVQEQVGSRERDLDESTEPRQFLGSFRLEIRDPFKVGDELFYGNLPSRETFHKDIGRSCIMVLGISENQRGGTRSLRLL